MTTDTLDIDCDAIRGAFREWHAEQEPLAAELTESLAALAAYQAHLDTWQQQLADQREALRAARDEFAAERAAAEQAQDESRAEVSAELGAAREKVASLTSALLARTEELRALDGRRAEMATELELARAREKDFTAKLEEVKQSREEQRAQWSAELRHLRTMLERRLESEAEPCQEADAALPPAPRPPAEPAGRSPSHSPVLGSIVEQFGKLRQQRSTQRAALNKSR